MSEELTKNNLCRQIREEHGHLFYTYKTHLKQCELLEKKNKCIKYTQIIFSALATGGVVGSAFINETVAVGVGAIFSTIPLAINLYYKDFNLVAEMLHHRRVADELWLIKSQYISLLTDFDMLENSLIRSKRDELQNKLYELYKHTPKTNSRSFKLAQDSIQNKEEHFFSNEELDKLLPPHLRCGSTNEDV